MLRRPERRPRWATTPKPGIQGAMCVVTARPCSTVVEPAESACRLPHRACTPERSAQLCEPPSSAHHDESIPPRRWAYHPHHRETGTRHCAVIKARLRRPCYPSFAMGTGRRHGPGSHGRVHCALSRGAAVAHTASRRTRRRRWAPSPLEVRRGGGFRRTAVCYARRRLRASAARPAPAANAPASGSQGREADCAAGGGGRVGCSRRRAIVSGSRVGSSAARSRYSKR